MTEMRCPSLCRVPALTMRSFGTMSGLPDDHQVEVDEVLAQRVVGTEAAKALMARAPRSDVATLDVLVEAGCLLHQGGVPPHGRPAESGAE